MQGLKKKVHHKERHSNEEKTKHTMIGTRDMHGNIGVHEPELQWIHLRISMDTYIQPELQNSSFTTTQLYSH